MKNFKNLKEKAAEKVKLHKLRIQGFFVALIAFMTTYNTYAYASIDGGNIKNNVINNILLPISFVVVGFLLIKELVKKSIAGIVVVLIVGGFVIIMIAQPDLMKSFGNFVKTILGL
ncbi:TPA: conjugal transfer membrane protein TcpD [Clostridium perfringens]|uniref:TcpD n=1 Tax=Clostridium perfringens TaxID=1502 RepID=Q2L5Y0_CLOPF|nr:conjugal transfer membrane protein TcpD [Clostridium perfringens]ABF47314.1 TcpD [Clostridium perfringens]EDT25759.1 TcpD [Clostridium perfringens CPE str. F4969]EGT3604147.1 TcpD [Clostridium perfringens]EJT6474925.1 TcpD [Clostridium perfringens]EJT6480734.1 TcpD [Clostridium perfringens]